MPEILSGASEYVIQSVVDALIYPLKMTRVDLRMNNKLIQLQDDMNGDVLDSDRTAEGMVKEIRALDSLVILFRKLKLKSLRRSTTSKS